MQRGCVQEPVDFHLVGHCLSIEAFAFNKHCPHLVDYFRLSRAALPKSHL